MTILVRLARSYRMTETDGGWQCIGNWDSRMHPSGDELADFEIDSIRGVWRLRGLNFGTVYNLGELSHPWGRPREMRDTIKSLIALIQLGCTLADRFDQLGYREDIDNAIRCQRLALFLSPKDHVLVDSGILNNLGCSYKSRFKLIGMFSDLDKAILCYRQAVLLQPENCAAPQMLNNLGSSYRLRFEHLAQRPDIDKAIECQNQAVKLAPDDQADKHILLGSLGYSYRSRFDHLGEPPDADAAIEYLTQAALLTPEGSGLLPALLGELGDTHVARFRCFGELADMEQAIEYHSQCVLLTSEQDASMPVRLHNLGNSYTRRYELFNELGDIDNAIECYQQAVLLTGGEHPDWPDWLNNLGNSYARRFVRLGKLSDLDKAIEFQSQAVLIIPDCHSEKLTPLSNLGVSYRYRFERFGRLADIEMAIQNHTQALLLIPDGHKDKPNCLSNLGCSYLCRFELLGQLSDIDQVIELLGEAVLLTSDCCAEKPSWLSNLGCSYLRRFEHLGKLFDVDQAIECHLHALQLVLDTQPDKATLLNNLGISYQRRYERLNELVDLDKAIESHSQAVMLTANDHADMPAWLNNLGSSHKLRFRHLGERPDIDKAIEYQCRVVEIVPDDHADKPNWLHNLGNAYRSRFECFTELSDVNKAIEYQSHAVRLSTDSHASKPSWLSSLGNSYCARYVYQGRLSDSESSIECHSQAVRLTPDGHGDKPSWLSNLGLSYKSRFDHARERSDLEAANNFYQQAAHCVIGHPQIRFNASRHWAITSNLLCISSLPAYQRTMELLPELVWLGVTMNQRYSLLLEIGDVAIEAAAYAISLNAYDYALEWLEGGRSVVWNQILQLRNPFEQLLEVDPAVARRLKEVAQQLENAGSRSTDTSWAENNSDLEQEATLHRRLAVEWDELLAGARRISGFDNFMRPHKAKDLVLAAKRGPVVVINVHPTRCDALIIQPNNNNIGHVPLGTFSLDKAKKYHTQFAPLGNRQCLESGTRHFKRRQDQTEPSFKNMLTALWQDVVKPILEFLRYTQKQPAGDHELPGVTWCTTGDLSFLPLHAAGCYDGSQQNVFDLVISSYTPTLSALLAHTHKSGPDSGILAVGQENTKGLSRLPCTRLELATITKHAQAIDYMQLEDENATVDAVLNAMVDYSWVHFACHATQRTDDPTQSAFHLHDGDLILSRITKRWFENKGLAFLSACQTATGSRALPDEAVHLAAGMLMAGYPSVIATMWAIQDEDAPEIARDVYAELLQGGKMDCGGTAKALHKAVGRLRTKIGEAMFDRWVPFVHIGV